MYQEKKGKTNKSHDKVQLKENFKNKMQENELSITQRKDFVSLQRKQKIR